MVVLKMTEEAYVFAKMHTTASLAGHSSGIHAWIAVLQCSRTSPIFEPRLLELQETDASHSLWKRLKHQQTRHCFPKPLQCCESYHASWAGIHIIQFIRQKPYQTPRSPRPPSTRKVVEHSLVHASGSDRLYRLGKYCRLARCAWCSEAPGAIKN
eukprot:5286094-Amphidinium_carterae.1